jgi:hypothetical protein
VVGIDAIAQSGAAFVEHDQTRERAQPAHQIPEPGLLPVHLQVRDVARYKNEIAPIADHLIDDANIAAAGVAGLRRCLGDKRSCALKISSWQGGR